MVVGVMGWFCFLILFVFIWASPFFGFDSHYCRFPSISPTTFCSIFFTRLGRGSAALFLHLYWGSEDGPRGLEAVTFVSIRAGCFENVCSVVMSAYDVSLFQAMYLHFFYPSPLSFLFAAALLSLDGQSFGGSVSFFHF